MTRPAGTDAPSIDGTDVSNSFTSRGYQLEIFEKAKQGNIIACLDTGSGKTHIARLLIDWELQRKPSSMIWFLTQHQALATQQHLFLSTQLPAYSFRLITGSDNAEYWASEKVWEAALRSKNGVVSTAQILFDALSHQFISLDSISLLVFDEAHHCVRNNPYNKIMGLLKHRLQEKLVSSLPRILGLTATPIIRDDLNLVQEVESSLTAVCCTPVSGIDELRAHVHLPRLVSLAFDQGEGYKTALTSVLESILRCYCLADDPTVSRLKQSSDPHDQQKLAKIMLRAQPPVLLQIQDLLRKAQYLAESLGWWATDRYVRACVKKLISSIDEQQACLFTINSQESVHMANLLTPLLQTEVPPNSGTQQVTPKVQVLLTYLRDTMARDTICVIFVERRTTAYGLQDILASVPELSTLNPFTFVGSSNPLNRQLADLADLTVQQDAFADFRQGRRQICIATQVLEEGIDVQSCNLVICFDPPATARSYVQRRGRARHPNGHFVLMQPHQVRDAKQEDKFKEWAAIEAEMKRVYAEENRYIQQAQARQDTIVEQIDLGKIRGATGAEVNYSSARQHLQHFCETMRSGSGRSYQPLYLVEQAEGSAYTSRVVLPTSMPPEAREAHSLLSWPSESAAKKDAALQAYRKIQQAGLLNDHLLPVHTENRQKDDYYRAIETRGSFQKVGPAVDIWRSTRLQLAEHGPLFASRVFVEGLPVMLLYLPFQLLCAVTCKLYTIRSGEASAHVQPAADITIPPRALLTRITKFLFQTVLLRRLPGLMQDDYSLPYFLVPAMAEGDWQGWLDQAERTVPFSDTMFDTANEVLIRKNGDSMPYFHKPRNQQGGADQQVTLDATRLPRIIDFSRRSEPTNAPSSNQLDVSECRVSGLAPDLVRVVAYMPTVMHFVLLALRAQEAVTTVLKSVDLVGDPAVYAAFVAPGAGQISYQRLEYLGDVVLKYMATINVFCTLLNYPEGALSVAMDRLVNNARLQRSALKLGIDQFITTEAFSGQAWTLADCEIATRQISTKTLADVIEALLGAAFQRRRSHDFDEVVKCLSLFLPEVMWQTPKDAIANYPIDRLPDNVNAAYFENVQGMIGYRFTNPVLLAEALNHSSPNISLRSYDRLEYLGDAVIDLIVKVRLFNSSHEFGEHHMTLARHALVNKETFAFLATRFRKISYESNPTVDMLSKKTTITKTTTFKCLHDYLSRQPSLQLASQRQRLLHHYQNVEAAVTQALTVGREWPWADLLHLDSPKWASDVLESIIGAVFIDSGATLPVCIEALRRMGLMDLVDRAASDDALEFTQKKAVLREMKPGKVKFDSKQYRDEGGKQSVLLWKCAVYVDGDITATVDGCSCEAEAEERAAIQALQKLETIATDAQHDSHLNDQKRKRTDGQLDHGETHRSTEEESRADGLVDGDVLMSS